MNLLRECDEADDFAELFQDKEQSNPHPAEKLAQNGVKFLLQSSVEMPLPNHEQRFARKQLHHIGMEEPFQLSIDHPRMIYGQAINVQPPEMQAVSQNGSAYAASEPANFEQRHLIEFPGDCRRRWSTASLEKESQEGLAVSGNRISKNQTKNIPKNYGKAIITFIERNKSRISRFLESYKVDYHDLLDQLRRHKKGINTIADLRSLWTQSKYSEIIRVLSNLFLRKYSLQYIFNSRVSNFGSHIKYRQKLREALKDPSGFRNIKDY